MNIPAFQDVSQATEVMLGIIYEKNISDYTRKHCRYNDKITLDNIFPTRNFKITKE